MIADILEVLYYLCNLNCKKEINMQSILLRNVYHHHKTYDPSNENEKEVVWYTEFYVFDIFLRSGDQVHSEWYMEHRCSGQWFGAATRGEPVR